METAERPATAKPEITANLEVVNGCNIECQMCQQHDPIKKLQWTPHEQVKKILPDLAHADHIYMGNGSEHLIHPEWEAIMSDLTRLVPKVGINTNAKMIRSLDFAKRLVGVGLDVIQISIDGVTDETVSRVRKGITFTEIARAIDWIQEAKIQLGVEKPTLQANAVAMRSNLHEMAPLARFLAEKRMAQFRIGFLQVRSADSILAPQSLIYAKEEALQMLVDVEAAADGDDMELDLSLFRPDNRTLTRATCDAFRKIVNISFDGVSGTCWHNFNFGNIYQQPIVEPFRMGEHLPFVTQHIRDNPQMCEKCTYCDVMDLDTISDHFGQRAVFSYSDAFLEKSVHFVQKGGSPEAFFKVAPPFRAHEIAANTIVENDPGVVRIIDFSKKRYRFHSFDEPQGPFSCLNLKVPPDPWQRFFYDDVVPFTWSRRFAPGAVVFDFGADAEIFSPFIAIYGDARVYTFHEDPEVALPTFTNIQYNRAVYPRRKWEVMLLPLKIGEHPPTRKIEPQPELLKSVVIRASKRTFFLEPEVFTSFIPQRDYSLTELVAGEVLPIPNYLRLGSGVNALAILKGVAPLLMNGVIQEVLYTAPFGDSVADPAIVELMRVCGMVPMFSDGGHTIFGRNAPPASECIN
ncbi:MAG: radical SAM protein [Magnetococcales bacterium]|nr:radical SAM protein [Magnetococcales bacterium]